MILFAGWYLIGLISTIPYVIIVNKMFKHPLTYGDIIFIVSFSFGGVFVPIALILMGISFIIVKIILSGFLSKPVFKEK